MTLQARPRKLPYSPGLDGIRAIAVLAIIAFHAGIPWFQGGFYGVDTFFVLSGYLITSLLVVEWGHSGTIAVGKFGPGAPAGCYQLSSFWSPASACSK
jgi:peptidoglycan/LPS O-acetylase OafA/YrhL